MAGKRAEQVVVDPIAAAQQLESLPAAPWADPGHDVAGDVREAMRAAEQPGENIPDVPDVPAGSTSDSSKCALGHGNDPGARFCVDCGLAMDAPAPVKVDLAAAQSPPGR